MVACQAVETQARSLYHPLMAGEWKRKLWQALREAVKASGLSYTDIAGRTKTVESKHLSAFMRDKGGFDMDKIEEVAKVRGVDLLSLVTDVQPHEKGRSDDPAHSQPLIDIGSSPTRSGIFVLDCRI